MSEWAKLTYKVDDRPPLGALLLLAAQHMFVPVSYSVFAIVVIRSVGGSDSAIEHVTTMALIASAIGVALQAIKRGPVGSGYLAAHIPSAIYIPASISAGIIGGLPLICGMTVIAGLFEAILSRVISYLKAVFPPVVCGLVVIMVGFSLVALAMEGFLGMDRHDHVCDMCELLVSSLTLACLVGLSIWGKGWLRLYSILISILIGYGLAWAVGLVSPAKLLEIERASWVAWPRINHQGFAFDYRMLLPFLVAALAAAVKSSGLLVTCQRINDPDWKEPDMKNVGNGVLADALGTFAGGLLGTIGTNISPTSVGLTGTTGATSRIVGLVTALLVLCAAFMPKVITVISLTPVPVLGAVLVYAVCIISASGFKLIFTGDWDLRRSFLVGITLLVGLSAEINPHLYYQLPPWAQTIIKSPIAMCAITAIVLNLLFQLGRDD